MLFRSGTPLIETGGVIRTVSVGVALRLLFIDVRLRLGRASDQRVANPAWWTRALGHVVLDTARGGGSAGVLIQTRVGALVVDAGSILGTVLVDATLHSDTADIGVTLQTGGTTTRRLVVGGVAFSIGSAGIVSDTGIKTISVSTHFGDGTFGVGAAAN